MSDTILLIGLDLPEARELQARSEHSFIIWETLPKLRIVDGQLQCLRPDREIWRDVSRVVFHAIFENDLPTLAALMLWGGPCLPNPVGLYDCRPRISNLARCRRVSQFATLPRCYGDPGTTVTSSSLSVAKFGEWHCGEGKELFRGDWKCVEPTLVEPFVEGEAVRVQLLGDRAWQIRLGGSDWKKSIHGTGAELMPLDSELVADCRRLAEHFQLELCAADYIVGTDNQKHLLELNHIPNVTEFPEIREAYLDFIANWLRTPHV